VANPEKPAARQWVRRAVALIQAAGRTALTDAATARFASIELETLPDLRALAEACDLLLVFGGDGSILTVARDTAGLATPMLGINLGTLGFLTAASASKLQSALQQVWAGQCLVETRRLIEANRAGARGTGRRLALNDFVITRGHVPRLIELEVTVGGELLTAYRGDGLIISSPTGSTAYSLAAGGAVVSPQADVFMLTPICPHTLSSRAVIVNLRSTIVVRLLSKRVETLLAADGQSHDPILPGESIRVRRSPHSAHLVHLPGTSFFETLRRKLGWSGSSL